MVWCGGSGGWDVSQVVCVCACVCSLGQIQAGDRVQAINGLHTGGLTLQQASKLIRESGSAVVMEVEFDVAGILCMWSVT